MTCTASWLVAVAVVARVIVSTAPASGRADQAAAATFVTEIPSGYRGWRVISVAHEEGNLNSLGRHFGQ
jgi:hypothetical protein